MADDITKDEQRRMEWRAYTQHNVNRVNQLYDRALAKMDDMISGSGDAEAAVIENTNQRKRPRFKEVKKLETEVSKLRAEIQRMKMEEEEMKYKFQLKDNENKELRRALKEMEENQKQMMQIPTSWEIHGQKFSSINHCEEWILSQPYGQVCQASDAGPSFIPGLNFNSGFDALNNDLFPRELVDGILNNPDAGYFSDAISDLSGFGDIDIDNFFCDSADGN